MSDTRLPPSVSDGTGLQARLMRGVVLGSIQTVLAATGSRRTQSGPIPIAPSVVAFHHTAPVDAFMIGLPSWHAGHHPIAMVKAGVFRHALAGPVVRTAGMIPVARDMAESRSLATVASLAHLEAGHIVHIAPGGTIHDLHDLPRWQAGVARIAQEAGVPIVPAVTFGPELWGGFHGVTMRYRAKTPVHVSFGEPLHPSPTENPVTVIERARQAVADLIEERTGRAPVLTD